MNPATLGRQLRQGSSPFLTARRRIAALSLASIGSLGLISLYQIGLLPHVPEPPLPGFDADKVNGSAEAYAKLDTPDAILGIGSYAATMALAMMGGPDRARRRPWIPLALAAKIGLDAGLSIQLFITQATKQKAFCFWCILIALATLSTAPLALPEARAALRQISGAKRRP